MNNKGVGVIFCLISAILISAKYISAAMFMSNLATQDASLFKKWSRICRTISINRSHHSNDHWYFVFRIWIVY